MFLLHGILTLVSGLILYQIAGGVLPNIGQHQHEFARDEDFKACKANPSIKVMNFKLPSGEGFDGSPWYLNDLFKHYESIYQSKHFEGHAVRKRWKETVFGDVLKQLHANFCMYIFKNRDLKHRYLESSFGVMKLIKEIPLEIMIDNGIICSETPSLISGVSIKYNVFTYEDEKGDTDFLRNESQFVSAMTCWTDGSLAEIVYVSTENSLVHVYYRCPGEEVTRELTFKIESKQDQHKSFVLKTKMKCRLREDQERERNESSHYVTSLQPYATPGKKSHLLFFKKETPAIHFELYFSYVCRFYSPLNMLKRAGYKNILQYQKFKISLGGYMELDGDKPFIGLVQHVSHRPESNPQNDPEFSFYNPPVDLV